MEKNKGKMNIYIGRNSSGKSKTIEKQLKDMDDFIKKFDDPSKLDDLEKVTSFLHKKLIKKFELELKISDEEKEKINKKFNETNEAIKELFPNNDYDDQVIRESLGIGIGVSKNSIIRDFDFLETNYSLGNGHRFYRLLILSLFFKSLSGDFAMDEPERFLHRELQIKLCKLLKEMLNSGMSIYIATHSEVIANELSDSIEDVNLVNKYEINNNKVKQNFNILDKKVSFEKLFEEDEFWNLVIKSKDDFDKISQKNYFDNEGNFKKEIIEKFINDFFKFEIIKACFANRIILVEGDVEKEILSRNTDYHIIKCAGKINVLILSYILNQLNLNFIGIIDKDEKGGKENVWFKFNRFGKNIKVLNKTNIEDELNIINFGKGANASFYISTRNEYLKKGSNEPVSIEKEISNFLKWVEECLLEIEFPFPFEKDLNIPLNNFKK